MTRFYGGQTRSPPAHSVFNRTRATLLEPLRFDNYDVPSASDIEAFRGESATDHHYHHLAFNHRPSQVVIIGVARWFGRTVAQRVVRHARSSHRGGGQQLLTLDLVMFLLTEGHVLEHCSIEIYASHFPSYSKLFMEDLETQCRDVGKALQSFDIKYAAVWDAESLNDFRARVSETGVNLGSMSGEDWKFLWALESEWVNE
ncbi:hypothetical protein HPB52_018773 [Rhipicephalus sanguineus]|uniref:Uncharacterized protein n=1 Tax=Rhipicephalus sanguineus TaxID=34632 RepID=A0A9D4PQW5_RHISA|nr:hypothetical protein HPB52_018773 [Rhipicephalus sanguineus]